MKKVKYVCSECGSDDILFDAFASWDEENQKMVLESTYEKGSFCNNCEQECSVNEIVINK